MDFYLDHLRAFIVVARLGNLSAAAKELGTTQPNLGRQMTALEKSVNLILFARHSRGISITKQGEDFLNLCENTVGQFVHGTDIIREKDSEPQGTLKILAGTGSGQRILSNLYAFSEKFPKLYFKFTTVTSVSQIKMGDIDVGIIPECHSDPGLIQHHLYDLTFKIYASPRYFKNHPKPKTLEDLQSHKLINYCGENQDPFIGINTYLIDNNIKNFNLPHFIEVNNGMALRTAIVDGYGIGSFWYDRDLMEQNLLVDVFPNLSSHKISFYYVYHPRLENSPKVAVFHEFLKEICKPLQMSSPKR